MPIPACGPFNAYTNYGKADQSDQDRVTATAERVKAGECADDSQIERGHKNHTRAIRSQADADANAEQSSSKSSRRNAACNIDYLFKGRREEEYDRVPAVKEPATEICHP